jgi:hypothetical protein
VNKLQPVFDVAGHSLKQELAAAFVPIFKRTSSIMHLLEAKPDKKLVAGIHIFDNACRGAEASYIRNQDTLKQEWMNFQVQYIHSYYWTTRS